MKTKAAAVVTIRRARGMSKRGRMDVAKWLRRQAFFLEKHSKELSDRYTARYLYR